MTAAIGKAWSGTNATAIARAPRRSVRERVRSLSLEHRFLVALLILFTAKQVFAVIAFPPFSGHDEVAHFSYAKVVATDYRVPRLVELGAFRAAVSSGGTLPGDYFSQDLYKYCRYVLDWYCDPVSARWKATPPHIVTVATSYYPSGWQYAANHPPLYYLLMSPVYLATKGSTPAVQQYAMRTATIPFGIATVVLAFLLASTLFPGDPFIPFAAATFVAFQPQLSYEASMVNNDIVGIAAVSLLLYLLARGLRFGFSWRLCTVLGLSFGLGLLAKSTTMLMVPGIALAMVLGIGPRRFREWLPKGAAVGGTAALLVAPWYVFLYRTYGNFSGLDQIAANQWEWTYRGETPPSILKLATSGHFLWMRWRESWGEFGWRLIPLDTWLLVVIAIPVLLGAAGFVRYVVVLWRTRHQPSTVPDGSFWRPARWQTIGIGVLVLTAAVAYLSVLQFGTRFQLTQARYMFPAANAAIVALVIGWRAVVPLRSLIYARASLFIAMIALNILIFSQYVLPFWHLRT